MANKLTSMKTPKILDQYLNEISLKRNRQIKYDNDVTPTTEVSGGYILENDQQGLIHAITKLNVRCKHQGQEILSLDVEYEGVFEPGDLTEEELSVFLNLEYPPVVLNDARKLVADLTSETGIVRINIDPWDFVRQFLDKINADQQT